MKCIVYTRPDGGVSVCHPAPDARRVSAVAAGKRTLPFDPPIPFYRAKRAAAAEFGEGVECKVTWAETEDEFVARIQAKDVPADAQNVCVCDASELPDRSNRKAWRQNGKGPPVVDAAPVR